MTGKNVAGRNVNIRFSRRIHHKVMSQNDLSAAGRVRQQATPQGCCQIMPSDDDEMLPMADASAPETISVVSNQLLHAANVPEVRAPRPDEMLLRELPDCRRVHVARTTGGLLAILGIGFLGGSAYYGLRDYLGRELSGNNAIAIVVERIIDAESNGCPNLKNTRSTASGAGQFLDETWVRLIRAYRPDIARRSEREVLELRRDPELAREITTRLAEQSAAKLRQHGFPVTQGTLYLAHFAGTAGAVAILSAAESADAASVMASADATGRTTREKIANANPFLQRFTVADLKSWANRKMNKKQVNQICRVISAEALQQG